MTRTLTITFLEQARAEEAVGLLCRVFNENEDKVRAKIEKAFSDDPYHPVFLEALVDGRLVGIVSCNTSEKRDRDAAYELTKLAVDPGHRRDGIGRALVERAEDFMRTAWLGKRPGFVSLLDATKKDNPDSRFYENAGYKPLSPSAGIGGLPILTKRLG